MALLTGEPRSAYIETLEETHLMVLSKDQFDRILRDCPDVSRAFAKEIRGWLLQSQKLLETEAQEAYKATKLSWLDFVVVFGVSIVLALVFNSSNPNGIPLFPKFPDQGPSPSSVPRQPWKRFSAEMPSLWMLCPPILRQAAHQGGGQHAPGSVRHCLHDEFRGRG